MNFGKLIFYVALLIPFGVKANNISLKKDSIPFLNYDRNLDSMISTLYSKPEGTDNPLILTPEDSAYIFSDRPDTFFINRLKKIPSVVNLVYNRIVKNYIAVYTIKKRDKLEEILGLKDYYFPIFEEIFDKFKLPLELKYLAVIESALNPRAVSKAGATGLWQFMYGTGRLYKLNINSFVDERNDPIAETYAAAKFLSDLYKTYNDWTLVIAAYNCGPGNVNKAIHRSGGKTNYWDIYYYLPQETRGYVPAFIAATYSIMYYKDHNLVPKKFDMPAFCDTVMVRDNIHLQQIADVLKVPVDLVRNLNPQYRRDIIPGKFSASPLMLPAQYATRFIDMKDSIVNYKNDVFFANDFKVVNPLSRSGRYAVAEPSGDVSKIYHKVSKGQTLSSIARRYHVNVGDLKFWNDIRGNHVSSGKKLVVYVSRKNSSSSTSVAQQHKSSRETDIEYIYYKVRSGDTINSIASNYDGVTADDLIKWNNLRNANRIHPGQTLKIKRVN